MICWHIVAVVHRSRTDDGISLALETCSQNGLHVIDLMLPVPIDLGHHIFSPFKVIISVLT